MVTKVQKWGNSLALRIPKSFAAEAHVAAGSSVDISVREGALMIRPVHRGKYRLSVLLQKITKRNLHDEVSFGSPVGRETW